MKAKIRISARHVAKTSHRSRENWRNHEDQRSVPSARVKSFVSAFSRYFFKGLLYPQPIVCAPSVTQMNIQENVALKCEQFHLARVGFAGVCLTRSSFHLSTSWLL